MRTLVHVNQLIVRANARTGANDAPLTVKTWRENRYARAALVHGPSELVYSPHKPLSCGARLWLQTQAEVSVYEQAQAGRRALVLASAQSPFGRKETTVVVQQAAIRENLRAAQLVPVLAVHAPGAAAQPGFAAQFAAPCLVLYDPQRTHPSGAQIWLATLGAVAVQRRWGPPGEEAVGEATGACERGRPQTRGLQHTALAALVGG